VANDDDRVFELAGAEDLLQHQVTCVVEVGGVLEPLEEPGFDRGS
jgi:hypothetical protein